MHKDLSSALSTEDLSTAQSGWDDAITEAESQIAEALNRVRRLKGAIRTFEELRAEGAALPETESDAERVM